MGWGFDTCQKFSLKLNSLSTGKSFQSNVQKCPHPGLHMVAFDLI